MLILLPPSESKSQAAGPKPITDPDAIAHPRKILNHIKRLKTIDRAKFYAIKDKTKCQAAHKLNLAALESPALPAIERYTGVVYQFIDYATLKRKREAGKRIHIVSAFFGLINAATPIPNYKMPMNPWLIKYWRPLNTQRLEAAAQGKPVLNLLSQSYAKALDYEPLITIDFKLQGGKKSAGHFGKAIKGRFVRFLIENQIESPKDFAAFKEDNYQFDGTNFIQS